MGGHRIARAWYCDNDRRQLTSAFDVTATARAIAAFGKDLKADNKLFGDPAWMRRKVLIVDFEAVCTEEKEEMAEVLSRTATASTTDTATPEPQANDRPTIDTM